MLASLMVASHMERKHYWHHWTLFIEPFHGVDPKFTNVSTDDRIKLITTFAKHIHTGTCGQGNCIQAGTIQVVVCTIGKTFELDRHPNEQSVLYYFADMLTSFMSLLIISALIAFFR